MAPLAKIIHDNIVETCTNSNAGTPSNVGSSVQQPMSAVTAAPATPWSCAVGAPASVLMIAPARTSLSSSSSSHSNASTSSDGSRRSMSNSSRSSSSSRRSPSPTTTTKKRTSLTVLHNVGGAFRALLLVLERYGVARASIRELQHMILNEQYMDAMERAEEYVDCLLGVSSTQMGEEELASIIVLIVTAWESLRDYSRTVYKERYIEYNRWENQHWIEFIEYQNLSPYEQIKRKRRQMDNLDPTRTQEMKHNLFLATRFKIDCEKGLIQSTEWSRYLRAQQQQHKSQQQSSSSSSVQ